MSDVAADKPEPVTATSRPETVGAWSGPLPSESGPTRRERLRQGVWRERHLQWPAGQPQNVPRVRSRYPTLPNWLADDHEGDTAVVTGVNIMSDEARAYTRARLPILETIDGKAETDRLWRNLLSSQPMAFSIAGHLRSHSAAAAALLGSMTGLPVKTLSRLDGGEHLTAYALRGVEAEWFPPRMEHTGDMSGCDIAACVELIDGRRVLITIEVKYTDTFSAKLVAWDRYRDHLTALGLDQEQTGELAESGCSQVLRQVMITDSVRRSGLAAGVGPDGHVDDVLAVVLGREDDKTAQRVAETLHRAVGAVVPVQFWSHRQLLDEASTIDDLTSWARDMAVRYLGKPD